MWKIQKLKLQISVLFSLSSEQCKERVSEPRQQPGAESPSWTWEHAGQERAPRGRGNTRGTREPAREPAAAPALLRFALIPQQLRQCPLVK